MRELPRRTKDAFASTAAEHGGQSKDLPRLVFVADRFTQATAFETTLRIVSEEAVPWVHLRDHQADGDQFRLCARELVDLSRSQGNTVRISVNTRHRIARDLDVDIHASHLGPSPDVARKVLGPDRVIGFSAHEPADLNDHVVHNVDYVFFSPVFDPGSKPEVRGQGLDALAAFCLLAGPIPVIALGGITPGRAGECLSVGAYGIAVVSGILGAEDPVAAAAAYAKRVYA